MPNVLTLFSIGWVGCLGVEVPPSFITDYFSRMGLGMIQHETQARGGSADIVKSRKGLKLWWLECEHVFQRSSLHSISKKSIFLLKKVDYKLKL